MISLGKPAKSSAYPVLTSTEVAVTATGCHLRPGRTSPTEAILLPGRRTWRHLHIPQTPRDSGSRSSPTSRSLLCVLPRHYIRLYNKDNAGFGLKFESLVFDLSSNCERVSHRQNKNQSKEKKIPSEKRQPYGSKIENTKVLQQNQSLITMPLPTPHFEYEEDFEDFGHSLVRFAGLFGQCLDGVNSKYVKPLARGQRFVSKKDLGDDDFFMEFFASNPNNRIKHFQQWVRQGKVMIWTPGNHKVQKWYSAGSLLHPRAYVPIPWQGSEEAEGKQVIALEATFLSENRDAYDRMVEERSSIVRGEERRLYSAAVEELQASRENKAPKKLRKLLGSSRNHVPAPVEDIEPDNYRIGGEWSERTIILPPDIESDSEISDMEIPLTAPPSPEVFTVSSDDEDVPPPPYDERRIYQRQRRRRSPSPPPQPEYRTKEIIKRQKLFKKNREDEIEKMMRETIPALHEAPYEPDLIQVQSSRSGRPTMHLEDQRGWYTRRSGRSEDAYEGFADIQTRLFDPASFSKSALQNLVAAYAVDVRRGMPMPNLNVAIKSAKKLIMCYRAGQMDPPIEAMMNANFPNLKYLHTALSNPRASPRFVKSSVVARWFVGLLDLGCWKDLKNPEVWFKKPTNFIASGAYCLLISDLISRGSFDGPVHTVTYWAKAIPDPEKFVTLFTHAIHSMYTVAQRMVREAGTMDPDQRPAFLKRRLSWAAVMWRSRSVD